MLTNEQKIIGNYFKAISTAEFAANEILLCLDRESPNIEMAIRLAKRIKEAAQLATNPQ